MMGLIQADPQRGEGKFTKVEVGATLDVAMAGKGEKVYGVKCSSCHKVTNEKLVVLGLAGCNGKAYPRMDHEFYNKYRRYAE